MTSAAPAANRAVRLQLHAKLDRARHAGDLLHSKEQALQHERTRLQGHADRTRQQWNDRCEEAASWLLRARALGGSAELARLHEPEQRAGVTINWQTAMGVTYPGTVDCDHVSAPQLVTTAALIPSTAAYRAALDAAAQHGAAAVALGRLEAELTDTRRRRRAIEHRLQPRLEAELHQLDLDLDERDRDAALRTQLATRHDRRRR